MVLARENRFLSYWWDFKRRNQGVDNSKLISYKFRKFINNMFINMHLSAHFELVVFTYSGTTPRFAEYEFMCVCGSLNV